MRKSLILTLLISLSIAPAFAGTIKVDSMYAVLKTEKEDTNKVSTLISIGFQLIYKANYSVGDSLSEYALQLANRLDYKRGIARALRNIGLINTRHGDAKKALECYKEALKLYEGMNDISGQASVLNSLGNLYDQTGDYAMAIDNFFKVRDMFTSIGNKQGVAIASNNLGIIYLRRGNYPKALDNFLVSLKGFQELGQKNYEMEILLNVGIIYDEQGENDKAYTTDKQVLQMAQETGDKRIEANVLDNLGNLFQKEKKYKEALAYSEKGLKQHEENGEKVEVIASLNDFGQTESHLGNYDTALVAFRKALAIGEDVNYAEGIGSACNNIAATDTLTKNYTEALEYANKGLQMGKKIGSMSLIEDAEGILSSIYARKGDNSNALIHYKAFITARDSIYSNQNTKKMVAEEMNFDFDKKQAEEKAKQDQKNLIAEQERKKQAVIRNSFIVGFALMIALAFFIFRGYREKQKANLIITQQKAEVEQQKELVEHQKAIVEEKNKDITDSIHYASRIQHALLTTDEYLGNHLKEYFILFKPRDIVSGDFYWAYSTPKGAFHIACCDCTGHGVPGAFMSLLNISMLNESVIERNITRPDLVLNDVRTNIIKALNPKGLDTESKDGMDSVFCTIDMQNKMLHMACANNPVWIIRENSLAEIHPDKMPVGIQYGTERPFTLHSQPINTGDCIYLFTDGYADQFGGSKGKKFKYKELKQLILDNCKLTMQEQKTILDKTFESWKGDLEQVDDVLIIGIRI